MEKKGRYRDVPHVKTISPLCRDGPLASFEGLALFVFFFGGNAGYIMEVFSMNFVGGTSEESGFFRHTKHIGSFDGKKETALDLN